MAAADNPQLVTDFNQGLESMRGDGRLAAMLSHYPQVETTQTAIAFNPPKTQFLSF
ncbi:MAG: hypothetical protein ACRC1W_10905 [Shewanella sp.]